MEGTGSAEDLSPSIGLETLIYIIQCHGIILWQKQIYFWEISSALSLVRLYYTFTIMVADDSSDQQMDF